MRVGYLATVLRTPYSGVERCVAELGRALLEFDSGNEYVFFTPRDLPAEQLVCWQRAMMRAEAENDLPFRRVRRAPFNSRWRVMRFLWKHIALPRILHDERIDLLHAPAYVAPKTSVPTVLTVYDVIALTHPKFCKPLNRLHFRFALPASVRAATRVIVPSEATKRELCRTTGVREANVRIIPPGVSSEFRRVSNEQTISRVRKRYGLGEQVILFVGNLEPKKDVSTLLRAFARLKRQGLRHQLVLAGAKRWLAGDVHRAIQEHPFHEDIRDIGRVSGVDLPALYSLADVFVFPSIVEGFGLPPLEAMACGTAVVTSDAAAVLETVGDAGLTFPVGDDAALAEAVIRVTADEELRKELVERGIARAARFTWEQAARETVAVYREAYGG